MAAKPIEDCRRAGQSLIESCIVIALVCLIFMAVFQVTLIFSAREILHHASARGARAKTVGFNHWMVTKAVRVASIPNAGRMEEPEFVNEDPGLRAAIAGTPTSGRLWERLLGVTPSSLQYNIERARIPEYLAAQNYPRAAYVLDYDRWHTIRWDSSTYTVDPDGGVIPSSTVHVRARQDYPLMVPMHRTFYADGSIELEGETWLENHYPLYIDDRDW